MKKLALGIFIVLMVFGCVVAFTHAQYGVVGVHKGDWIKYGNFAFYYHTNDSYYNSHTNPALYEQAHVNKTEWQQMTVTNVSQSWVYYNITTHYKNGTESYSNSSIDVYHGFFKYSTVQYPVISANLNVGEMIYNDSMLPFFPIISSELNRTYGTSTRLTNVVNETEHWIDTRAGYSFNGTVDITTTYFWDKATGMKTEYLYTNTERFGNGTTFWSVSYSTIDTNNWVIPEYGAWQPALIFIASASAILFCRKRFQNRN